MKTKKRKDGIRIQKKEDKNKNKDKDSLADQTEEELKLIDPEKYNELINSIKETLEQEKQHPGYIKQLFANQMDCLIDPEFILSDDDDDDPNKLRLIIE